LQNASDCLAFLGQAGIDPLQALQTILDNGLYGVTSIAPTTNANGTTTVNNGDFGLIAGQVITVNTEGAFFKSTYNGMSLTTDRGRIPGGTQQAQVFVDLHELAHSTLESSSAYLRDNNNQNAVNRNDRALETHCSKTIKAAK